MTDDRKRDVAEIREYVEHARGRLDSNIGSLMRHERDLDLLLRALDAETARADKAEADLVAEVRSLYDTRQPHDSSYRVEVASLGALLRALDAETARADEAERRRDEALSGEHAAAVERLTAIVAAADALRDAVAACDAMSSAAGDDVDGIIAAEETALAAYDRTRGER